MAGGAGKVKEALEFLKTDAEKAVDQWESGDQFKSILQRSDVDLKELETKFDPSEAENGWTEEYGKRKNSSIKLQSMRRRLAFLQASMKEFHEEYDDGVTDVDYMRLLEVPFTDSKYVIDFSSKEIGTDNAQ